jgi:hypothetical protein
VALLRRLLPSDGHKLVKKKNRPKSAPDRPFFDRPSYFKSVWRAASSLKGTGGFPKSPIKKPNYLWFTMNHLETNGAVA